MINLSKKVKSLEIFQTGHLKTCKNYNNKHFRQVYHKHHQYNYYLGYLDYNNLMSESRALTR